MSKKVEIEGVAITIRESSIRNAARSKAIAEWERAKKLPRKERRAVKHKALVGLAKIQVLEDIAHAKKWAKDQPPLAFHSDMAGRIPYPTKIHRRYDEIWFGDFPPEPKKKKYPKLRKIKSEITPNDPTPVDIAGEYFDYWLNFVKKRESVSDDTSMDVRQ
jgi:hypothetical protein